MSLRGKLVTVAGIVLLALAAVKWAADGRIPLGDAATRPTPSANEIPGFVADGMEPRVVAAIENARTEVRENLDSPDAWGQLGIALDAHDLDLEATAAYRIAHDLDPREFRWVYFLARTAEFGGGLGEEAAEELFEEAIALRPDYAPTFVRLGDNLVRQGRIADARAVFERAVELDPNLGKGHRGLGQALLSLGDADAAVPHLERAAALVPLDGAAQASLARAYTLTGDRDKARAAAEKSRGLEQLHSFPDPVTLEVGNAGASASICFRRARELMDGGDYRNAIPNLEIALEHLTQNPFIHARLGRCYTETGRLDLAESHFLKAVEMNPSMPDVLAQLGSFASTRADFERAIQFYWRSLAVDPLSAKTHALLAAALAQTGRTEAALQEFARGAEVGTLDAIDENNWGTALAQGGDPEAAARHFDAAVRLDPTFDNARYNLGASLEARGRIDDAIHQYEQVARRNPQHRAATRLDEIRGASR